MTSSQSNVLLPYLLNPKISTNNNDDDISIQNHHIDTNNKIQKARNFTLEFRYHSLHHFHDRLLREVGLRHLILGHFEGFGDKCRFGL